jgi:hypothetical protein
MSLGTKATLYKAATGTDLPMETPATTNPALSTAMNNKLQPAKNWSSFQSDIGLTTTPAMLNQGLSSKGKYAGYYTAADMQKAIEGDAVQSYNQATAFAEDLGTLATNQYNKYNAQSMYGMPTFQSNVDLPSGVKEQKIQEYQDYMGNLLPQVSNSLDTSANILQTPMYEFARALATKKYGLNPSIAAGMFTPEFDVEQYGINQDVQSMARTGMPFDVARQAASDARTALENTREDTEYTRDQDTLTRAAAIEDATGYSTSKMKIATSMTDQQLYDVVKDPKWNLYITGLDNAILAGSIDDAYTAAVAAANDPQTAQIGKVLLGYLAMRSSSSSNTQAKALAAEIAKVTGVPSFDPG